MSKTISLIFVTLVFLLSSNLSWSQNVSMQGNSMELTKIEMEVWQTIQNLNRAWTVERKPEKLAEYFHKEMVAIDPVHPKRLEGRDACVASWKAFVESTKIHYWKEIDPKVQLYENGKFAIVTYYWKISYDMNGQAFNESGRDMFALVNEDGKWWVVADQFSSNPKQ